MVRRSSDFETCSGAKLYRRKKIVGCVKGVGLDPYPLYWLETKPPVLGSGLPLELVFIGQHMQIFSTPCHLQARKFHTATSAE